MNALIQNIADNATTAGKALAVTAGGLIGVFATLAIFYFIILLANKIAERSGRRRN